MTNLNTLTIQNLYDTGNAARAALQAQITVLENNFKPGDDIADFETELAQIQAEIDALVAENTQLTSFVNNSGYLTITGTPTTGEQLSVQIGSDLACVYTVLANDTLQSIAQGLAAAINLAAQGTTANALGTLIQFSNLGSTGALVVANSAHLTINVISTMTAMNSVQNVFDYANAKITALEAQEAALIQAGGDSDVLQNNLSALGDAIAFLQAGQAKIQLFIQEMNL